MNTLRYKNVSHGTKKFRGVTFKPGEIKSVNGFIKRAIAEAMERDSKITEGE